MPSNKVMFAAGLLIAIAAAGIIALTRSPSQGPRPAGVVGPERVKPPVPVVPAGAIPGPSRAAQSAADSGGPAIASLPAAPDSARVATPTPTPARPAVVSPPPTRSAAADPPAVVNPAPKRRKPPIADPLARDALVLVGTDNFAELYWLTAINDPSLAPDERSDLIEDLNEEGFADPDNLVPQDLPLILARLHLIEQLAPGAMDQVNADAFQEAYKDLLEMRARLTPK